MSVAPSMSLSHRGYQTAHASAPRERAAPTLSPPRTHSATLAPMSEKRSAKTDAPAEVKPVEKNYITPTGYRRLTAEFDFLRAKKRPEVVSALADAAAEGDRSENAEYIYRKRQLRDIDRRLRFLSKRLDHVAVVDPREQKRRDRVFFGATVKVEDDNGDACVYRLVGVDEINGTAAELSW